MKILIIIMLMLTSCATTVINGEEYYTIKIPITVSPIYTVTATLYSMMPCVDEEDMLSPQCIKRCNRYHMKWCPEEVAKNKQKCMVRDGKPWWCPSDLSKY